MVVYFNFLQVNRLWQFVICCSFSSSFWYISLSFSLSFLMKHHAISYICFLRQTSLYICFLLISVTFLTNTNLFFFSLASFGERRREGYQELESDRERFRMRRERNKTEERKKIGHYSFFFFLFLFIINAKKNIWNSYFSFLFVFYIHLK